MSQEKTWMDNLIIEDTLQKENIPFYHYSEFENLKLIGGENVYKATHKISQKTIVLKYISLHDKFTLDNFINEVKRHRKLKSHDSVLKFYGITKQENTNNYMIILKYANNGSLRQYLKTNFQKMDWNIKLNIAKQIASVLMHLHSNEVIHGKLNFENIIVHKENIKLNYFGMAKHASESLKFFTNALGPIQYIDPQHLELFNIIGKNKCSDIFSLGIILWEISSGKPPFEMDSSSHIDLLDNIVKGEREMMIPGTPSKYKEIYTDCWNHNGNLRPEISQVVKNLSKITVSDVNVEFETSQSDFHNFTDEVISIELDKQHDDFEVQTDSPLIDVSARINKSINDLFEFFIDLYKKRRHEMNPVMIKNYIRKCNKSPVKVLYEMIRHPSYYWLTSLIGFFYLYGIGTIVDYKMAFKFFSLAANEITDMKNISFANSSSPLRKFYNINKEIGLMYLASLYLDGLGVEKDRKKAFQIFSKVADEGSLIALNKLANCYELGFGVEKNERKAFELHLESAEKGDLVAQYDVGRCYTCAKGISRDLAKGFQWYLKSALAGNIWAMCNTGYCYDYGVGVSKDVKEAFKWYSIAAESEYSLAQYNLGCYVGQVKSFEWFKKSAENGLTNGEYMVGRYFYQGHGTKQDIIKAIYWLNEAKENGSKKAKNLLNEIIHRYR
ncbi:hypothetical protein Glove_37g96 [Diversispora epigaea]|uniref:Protein kinase domain-containing protein n=1 Tax=Diversispora epigaea TaxID=1348612 RepID=A0A397JG79_9GLOM|nr:hypothetical protein Glove_37g96 [Diversispora epigaea]